LQRDLQRRPQSYTAWLPYVLSHARGS